MRSFILSSALLIILVQCGYPVSEYPTPPPSYPLPKKYPVPPYPSKPTYSAIPAPLPAPLPAAEETEEATFFQEEDNTTSDYRKKAKARTVQNRKFQRRALQPIRRFQQKKQ